MIHGPKSIPISSGLVEHVLFPGSLSMDSLKRFISANKRRRSSVASLGNRHDGKKGKKQKHVNKKNDIFPHGNYRQYYGNVERIITRVSIRLIKNVAQD